MLSLSRAITVSLCVVITGGILTSSALAQTEWTKYGRVVPDGLIGKPGEWDGIRVTEPSVLFRDGLYRIWYTGESGGYSQRIGYATSSDGIEWTKCVQNPVITPRVSGGFVYSSSVIFRNGKYEMWYVDVPRNGQPRHISYATSTNGVEWTPGNLGLQAEGGWEGSQVGYHCVIFHDEELKIWYSGFNGSIYQIGYATFKDGIDIEWNRHGPIDLEAHVILPSVIFRNGKYEMWYCNGSGGYTEIRYAISYNGVNWAKYEGNPVLVPGVSGEWDARSVSGPSVLFKDGEYKMWHTGENSEKIHSIGYATSLLPVVSAIDIDPDTLNLKSKGEWITCYIALPEDYDVHDIDVNTVFLEDVMTVQHSDIQGDVLMVKFSRQALVEYLDGTTGDVTLTVTGEVAGTPFEGSDTIRVIRPGKGKAPGGSVEFEALEPYPKPANPEVWIPYKLAKDVEVKITVYSASGHLIRTLNLGYRQAGIYTSKDKAAHWDGKNAAGEQVSSGIYFYTIQAGEFTATKKMIIAR